MVSGVMLGAPTLRVRGDYLAIVTLGFGEIIRLTPSTSSGSARAGAASRSIARPPEPSSCSRSRTSTGTAGRR